MPNECDDVDTIGVKVELHPDVVKEIDESRFYLAVVDDGFFENPLSIGEYLYAKSINKPVGIALKVGTNLPMEFMNGANVFAVEYWEADEHSIDDCADRLVEEYAKSLGTEGNGA